MDSDSDKTISFNSHQRAHSQSFNFQNLFLETGKLKPKNSKAILKNNRLYEHQRKKGDFNYLKSYVHKYFIDIYKNSKNDYNIRMIDDILNNESTHLVAEFKDYLIMGDITEFLQKLYNIKDCKKYLPKIYEYYNCSSVIFPNYVNLHESKYIYKNIRKKQKVIDNQQEQEEKKEKIKKGNIKLENKEDFFTTKTFNSILNQTNTSNVKLFFGINDNIDANETPNDIVAKLEQAEKEVMKTKINLFKNKNSNSKQMNMIMDDNNNNTTNNIKMNSNSNIFNNNNKIYNKNKYIKERKKNNNVNCLIGSKKKNNMKLSTNNNMNANNDMNPEKPNKILIQMNNYMSKNQNLINKEGQQKNHIQTSYNKTEVDTENNSKNNTTTFHGNSINSLKGNEIRKYLIDNIRKKQIYIRNVNNPNKNIKKQLINSLFPSRSVIKMNSNNNNNSSLKHNSFNNINKKNINKNIPNENPIQQLAIDPKSPSSPSTITIEANPFRNKKYKKTINIKESYSSRNISNNSKLNSNVKSKINVKGNQDKIKNVKSPNNSNNNQNITSFNNNTISTTTSKSKIVKYIHTNKNFVYNKAQLKSNHSKYGHLKNLKQIENKKSVNKDNQNQNINANNINNINNINNTNNYIIKNLNIHKINSSSNIQNPMNMNININMNNDNKNKIYFNNGSCTNVIQNKVYAKSPISIELETIKVTKKKRTLYPKTKTYSNCDLNQNIPNYHLNENTHTISNERNYYLDSINHTSMNSNLNEEYLSSRISPKYNNNEKKNFFFDDLYKKKNIILPFNKEINSINININEYYPPAGSLTSRISSTNSKNQFKHNNGIEEINIYSFKNKINSKNKYKNNISNKKSRNDNNPVKIEKMNESIKKNKCLANNKYPGYLSAKKK